MENGVKNGKATQFSKNNQPSGESKSKGWHRRRQAQEFMDKVMEYQELTVYEFEQLELQMAESNKQFTIRDLMAFRYAEKVLNCDKFLLDWLDRHVGKPATVAPRDEPESEEKLEKVIVEIISPQYDRKELEDLAWD